MMMMVSLYLRLSVVIKIILFTHKELLGVRDVQGNHFHINMFTAISYAPPRSPLSNFKMTLRNDFTLWNVGFLVKELNCEVKLK